MELKLNIPTFAIATLAIVALVTGVDAEMIHIGLDILAEYLRK